MSTSEAQTTVEKIFRHPPAEASFPDQHMMRDNNSFAPPTQSGGQVSRQVSVTPGDKGRASTISITVDAAEEAKRKKRAERFGIKNTEPEPAVPDSSQATDEAAPQQNDSVARLLNSAAAEAYANPVGGFPF